MANCCHFLMKIAGREEAVLEFIRMLQWKEEFSTHGLGHVQAFEVDEDTAEHSVHNDAYYAVEGAGDCDWSLKLALQDYKFRPLAKEVERLGLAIEAYSSEPGCEFQEHLFIDRGKILIDDCVHYEEYMIDGAEEEQLQELLEEKSLTREQLKAAVDHNGDYCEGGFSNFGEFRDLFPYLLSMQLQCETKWGESCTVYPYIGKYSENNNLFMGLTYFDKETQNVASFADITINAGKLPYLHSALNPFIMEEGFIDFLVDNGFGELTGTQLQADFSTYPVFRFNEEKLREVSMADFSDYARANGQRVLPKAPPLDKTIQKAEGKAENTSLPGNKVPTEPER